MTATATAAATTLPAYSLPPSLPSHPLVQTLRYVSNPLPLLDECAKRFGDIFTLQLVGTGNWVVLSNPRDLKAMFTANAKVAHAGDANSSVFGVLSGGNTVLTMDEDAHLNQRRLLLPSFQGERMQVYFDEMRDATLETINTWKVGQTFPMHGETQRITLRVIMKAIFGFETSPENESLMKLFSDFANAGVGSKLLLTPQFQWDLGRYSPWGRILHLNRESDKVVYSEIAKRRANPTENHDILSLMIHTKDDDGKPLSDRAVRDEVITMLMAGHETTGTALSWAVERILSMPEVHAKIESELQSVTGGGPLMPQHMPKLEYLQAAIEETHRLRPVMPIGGARKLTAPLDIAGYHLPVGTTVVNGMYLLHRRPDVYPEPDEFMPERFVGKRIDPYQWTPFGGGVRRCIGMHFALFEMKMVLATLFLQTRLRIENPNAPVRRRGFFLVPEGGPRVTLLERR
jgi:cytochrome P450